MVTFYSAADMDKAIAFSQWLGLREIRAKCTELSDERGDGFVVVAFENGELVAMSDEDLELL